MAKRRSPKSIMSGEIFWPLIDILPISLGKSFPTGIILALFCTTTLNVEMAAFWKVNGGGASSSPSASNSGLCLVRRWKGPHAHMRSRW